METKIRKEENDSRILFKSYYVVWKLHACEREKMIERRFKSYYVVWKRRAILLFLILYISLNRTM